MELLPGKFVSQMMEESFRRIILKLKLPKSSLKLSKRNSEVKEDSCASFGNSDEGTVNSLNDLVILTLKMEVPIYCTEILANLVELHRSCKVVAVICLYPHDLLAGSEHHGGFLMSLRANGIQQQFLSSH